MFGKTPVLVDVLLGRIPRSDGSMFIYVCIVYICLYIHMYIYIYVYICLYIYIYIYIIVVVVVLAWITVFIVLWISHHFDRWNHFFRGAFAA